MRARSHSVLASLALLATGAALAALRLAAAPTPPPATPSTARLATLAARGEPERSDQPGEAAAYWRRRHGLRDGERVPYDRYVAGLAAARRLPIHSTRRGETLPSAAELAARGVDAAAAAKALGTWTFLGPSNVGGRTRALVIDPTAPAVMYAGGVGGGIWKTTDGGASWHPRGDLLPNLAVASLAIDRRNPQTLYAGTGEGYFNGDAIGGGGVFATHDGGASWGLLPGTSGFTAVNDIVVSPNASNRIYLATDSGVWRSTDGGGSWTRVLDPHVQAGGCTDLAVRTDLRTDTLFASCGTFVPGSVWRATAAEGNAAWQKVFADPGMGRSSLAIAPSKQAVVYVLAASIQGNDYRHGLFGVFRSLTGGGAGSFKPRVRNTSKTRLDTLLLSNPVYAQLRDCGFGSQNQLLNQGWYDQVIAVDPKDFNKVWVGGIDLFRSDNGGLHWGLASFWWDNPDLPTFAHADQHALVFHPGYNGKSNQILFVGSDGGVVATTNARAATAKGPKAACQPGGALRWASVDRGYAVTQFYAGTSYPDGRAYFGGSQDNGTVWGSDAAGGGTGPDAWVTVLGGDGGFVAVDPEAPSTLWAEYTGISLQRTTDNGAHWADATTGIDATEDTEFIVPFVLAPSDSAVLYLVGSSVWRTRDGAASWTAASPRLTTDHQVLTAVAVHPSDADRVWAGDSLGNVFGTTVGLTSGPAGGWFQAHPADGYVSWVASDPSNPNVVYATYSNFDAAVHLWRSIDGGHTWQPWDGVGSRLPNVPANTVAVDPGNGQRLYVGTDLGVFVSLDGGLNWNVENTGFANVATNALVFSTAGGRRQLQAWTHGRGAWQVPTP